MIVFISNYFNMHQKPFCDSMYRHTDGDFVFIATSEVPDSRKKLGYPEVSAPYVVKYFDDKQKSVSLINSAGCVIMGSGPLSLIIDRCRSKKLTFRYNERFFKTFKNYFKIPIYLLDYFLTRNSYVLCASAFTAYDYYLMGAYRNKYYKWGYFPQLKKYDNELSLIKNKKKLSILWVGRMIEWKHPEYATKLASYLSSKGYDYHVDLVGTGKMENALKLDVKKNNLSARVRFIGALPQKDVRIKMDESDIFIFTSSKREGWGAVLNEAMNSGCAVVASSAIGSVPYLIKNGDNGLIYQDGDISSFFYCVERLLTNQEIKENIQIEAYRTMVKSWNSENAALSFCKLVHSLLSNTPYNIIEGPCSKAQIIKNNWLSDNNSNSI